MNSEMKNINDFDKELSERTEHVEQVLEKYLPAQEGYQKTLFEAMNYSVKAGGKRLRPLFIEAAYELAGGSGDQAEPFMAAMEMLHTYSLVHDDLPAMDNDEYRRGRKTTHVVYGEAMGILAGDGLLNYAFETAAKAFEMTDDPARVGRALTVFAKKAGAYGMIGGQTADVLAEDGGMEMTEELLLFIHEHKTAALIEASLMCGAILGGADEEAVSKLEKAGSLIGLAFQIQDDILDVTSTTEVLGKPVGSDEKNHKITYVTLKGMDKAQEDQKAASESALEILASFENRNLFLEELVRRLITRKK